MVRRLNMSNITVEKLASIIGSDPGTLLSQMNQADLGHSALSDEVTDEDKKILLDYLKKQQDKSSQTISLKKKPSQPLQESSGSIAITRKKATTDISSSSVEEQKKSSSSINFDEIENIFKKLKVFTENRMKYKKNIY